MDNNNQTPFIDSKLLILLTFANSLLFGYIKIYYESNSTLRLKIEIIWLLIKALIIVLNSKYMYKLVYNLTHDQDISVSFWSIIRNTHLLSCICTFMAFLILIWVKIALRKGEKLCCGVSREALLSGTVKDFSKEAIEIALKHYDDEEYVKIRQKLMEDIKNGD